MLILSLFLTLQTPGAPGAIQWTPREVVATTGEPISYATGWLSVPERHGASGGGSVRLHVARLGAISGTAGPPIVYLAGGPGVAGVPTRAEFSPLLLGLRASGDVILYDQRGTGQSLPSLAFRGRLDLPSDQPLRSSATDARLSALTHTMLDTLQQRGIDIGAYTTAQSVEDLEALRLALGAPRLVLWGHSYGSHLALAYLARYPTHVARLMIGGINATSQRWRSPMDGDVLLGRVDSLVRADPSLSRVVPDFLGLVRRVRSRLLKQPLRITQDGRVWNVGWDEVATTIAVLGGDPEFIKRLPQLLVWLDAGDASVFARVMRSTLHERPVGTAMSYAMHLASGVAPERLARINAEAPRALLGDGINWPWDVAAFARAWPVADLGEAFRQPVRSDVPALLYSGTLDGRTSLADAAEVARGLPNSSQIVVDGASHNSYQQSMRLTQLMLDFVAGRAVPGQHLSVPADLRGPEEARQIGELTRLASDSGGAVAAARLQALARDRRAVLTSYVPGTTAVQLMSGPKKFADAVALLESATTLFPASAFLQERLGDGYLALADTTHARAAYARAGTLDPYALTARAALFRLAPR